MAWIYLFLAGIFEIGYAISLKYTHGLSKWLPITSTIVFGAFSFYFMSLSLKSLPIGTAYAIWTGIGAVGVAIIGMIYFHEPKDIARILCIVLIVCGMVGLKVFSR